MEFDVAEITRTVREQGYAMTVGTFAPLYVGISAPVINWDDEICAAVTVVARYQPRSGLAALPSRRSPQGILQEHVRQPPAEVTSCQVHWTTTAFLQRTPCTVTSASPSLMPRVVSAV